MSSIINMYAKPLTLTYIRSESEIAQNPTKKPKKTKSARRNEITEALSTTGYTYTFDSNIETIYITNEGDYALDIQNLESTAQALIRSKGTIFTFGTHQREKRPGILTTTLGKRLLQALEVNTQEIKQEFSKHRFNPRVELLIEKMQHNDRCKIASQVKNIIPIDLLKPWMDELNNLIEEMINDGNSQEFKEKLAAHRRNINKNYNNTKKYLNSLCDSRKKNTSHPT
ncbi:hypothetical protein [Jeongeupia sp. USM3]|uniref:hypothetical protein n=1 Tax=Jeongeupia sp. USM3 TaxID=1906741 RepID=UPI0011AB69D7|nr:hypothetical protein [Jeongeupia sp. USM3]